VSSASPVVSNEKSALAGAVLSNIPRYARFVKSVQPDRVRSRGNRPNAPRDAALEARRRA
jgi:hypothetical protein